MKCKTKMEAFWVMSTMRDYMDHMPDEFSASDFSFRALKGRPGSTGFIQLSLMKLSVLTHFMETILPKFGNEQFKDVVKCELTEHKTFREKCGSTAHAADLSWQGSLLDSERQAISYLKARRAQHVSGSPCMCPPDIGGGL